MRTRIIHTQPLGRGGVVEGLIGRDQGYWGEPCILAPLAKFQGGGQLHCIIGAERMFIRQTHGLVEQGA